VVSTATSVNNVAMLIVNALVTWAPRKKIGRKFIKTNKKKPLLKIRNGFLNCSET